MASIGECHEKEYGCRPDAAASVPGRFHLLGEHTWFAGGNTLSMATDFRLSVSISSRQDSGFRIYFATTGERKKVSASNLKYRREDRWVNSLKAVISAFLEHGEDVPGMNIAIQSEIPPNTGLGVPNAMKVGLALALRRFLSAGKRKKFSDRVLLSLVERANTHFLNIHPHRADLFCALYAKPGSCIKTDFRNHSYEYAAFPADKYAVVLVDSRVPRIFAREELELRIQECIRAYEIVCGSQDAPADFALLENNSLREMPGLPESVRRRAAFILDEAGRVDRALRLLKSKDYAAFSKLVTHSHEGLRDRFEISCPELDWIVKRALEFSSPENPDLVCARMTGRGFGGCAYVILPAAQVPAFAARLEDYERIFGFRPQHYRVQPSGAAVLL